MFGKVADCQRVTGGSLHMLVLACTPQQSLLNVSGSRNFASLVLSLDQIRYVIACMLADAHASALQMPEDVSCILMYGVLVCSRRITSE